MSAVVQELRRFVHPQALVETPRIGAGSRISAFVFVAHDAVIEDDVFVGPNACILSGVSIGRGARVQAGSVVIRDVPSHAIVAGKPARIVGYVDVPPVAHREARRARGARPLPALRAKGARLHPLPLIVDLRGALTFGEIGKHLPFAPKRFFVIYDVPNMEVRGEHAHKEDHEFIVCVKGSCSIMLDDGEYRDELVLDSPSIGLHVPPRPWRVHYKYSADALTLVLASELYDAEDYIRDYQQFRQYIGKP